jgi:hypothetical protein
MYVTVLILVASRCTDVETLPAVMMCCAPRTATNIAANHQRLDRLRARKPATLGS